MPRRHPPMSVPLCPTCRLDTARAVLGGSQWSQVDYYGCERCGCVWTMRKLHPYDNPPTVIVKGKKISLTEIPKTGSPALGGVRSGQAAT